ncbi:MAG TPA: 23S rRNA (guanosine(2251)-2'-O)-methyltransferase RlmB [Flexilinea sp.]|nr:23S rRNA (guanosine(2251)-2'-O)-methyltransferase RlmB [Flexilinea sp.]
MKEWITSRNAAYEILRAGSREVFRLEIAKGATVKGRLEEIIRLAEKRKVLPIQVERSRLDSLDENHQGMALEASGFHYSDLPDIRNRAAEKQEPLFVLLLDLIQNPQNLGTLIRTAEAAGMHGIIIPPSRAAGVTPAVTVSSAGATEYIPIVQLNLSQAIRWLHEQGVWVIGLDGGAESDLADPQKLGGNLAIAVGSEGEGLRPLTRKQCDQLVRLPMKGRIESLNAASAGSIMIYLSYLIHRQ